MDSGSPLNDDSCRRHGLVNAGSRIHRCGVSLGGHFTAYKKWIYYAADAKTTWVPVCRLQLSGPSRTLKVAIRGLPLFLRPGAWSSNWEASSVLHDGLFGVSSPYLE